MVSYAYELLFMTIQFAAGHRPLTFHAFKHNWTHAHAQGHVTPANY